MKNYLTIFLIAVPLLLSAQWNLARYTTSIDSPNAMSVVTKDSLFYVNGEGGIHRSIDGGQNWTYFQTIFTSSWLLDINFPSKLVGYTCGGTNFGTHTNVIAKTIDGGETWDSLLSNTFSGYDFEKIEFFTEDIGFVSGNIPFLLKTIDGGVNFTQVNIPNNSTVTNISFNSLSNLIVSTFTYNGQNSKIYSILHSSDLGDTWTEVYVDTMFGVSGTNKRDINEVYFVDANYGFAVGGNGLFLKTTNGGNDWIRTSISPFNNLTGLYFTSKDIGYINNAGGIYKTSDGGVNWEVQNIFPLSIIQQISFGNDTIGYALGSIGIHKTINGGKTTGLTRLDDNFNVSISPNPFSHQTTLTFDVSLDDASLKIYNSYGKKVDQIEKIIGKSIIITRKNLTSGVYFLHISKGNAVTAIRKLVITNE